MTSTPETPDASASDEVTTVESAADDAGAPEETAGALDTDDAQDAAPSEPVTVYERLLAAHDLARAALAEITPVSTVGAPVDYVVEAGGVVSLRFANRLSGYPGWLWTVSVAVVDDAEPTVLEVELLPAAGALLAPEWVPWAVRLADYQAAQAAADEDDSDDDLDEDDAAEADDDIDDELDDDDEDADDDFADGSTAVTHAGDVDGVDIDALDAGASDDDEIASSDDEDSDEDDESDEDDSDEDDDESDHDESPWER